ncbi:MAG: hypothetical protein GY865_01095, partial [candidate division Zixibacteria bacterium]|nr:hypothetical protein [candidate division Zixibacteria bacterium]
MKFLRSKLSIPETAKHFIYRQRLIDKFIKKPDVNLFLFIAPAGYGKTTLSVQFLAKYKKILKSWYHIDRQDVDPKRFLAYLIETLSISLPFLQKSDLISKLVNKNAGIIEIVDDLCFYLQEYKGRDVWLVLDNWELIDKQTDICSIITQLISYGGTKLKIIINSRVRPSLHIQKLKVNNKAEIITQKEMAFNLTEFDDVIKTRLNSQIKEK